MSHRAEISLGEIKNFERSKVQENCRKCDLSYIEKNQDHDSIHIELPIWSPKHLQNVKHLIKKIHITI